VPGSDAAIWIRGRIRGRTIHFQFQSKVDGTNLAHCCECGHIIQRDITFDYAHALILLVDGRVTVSEENFVLAL
jgi:hypothetical protein